MLREAEKAPGRAESPPPSFTPPPAFDAPPALGHLRPPDADLFPSVGDLPIPNLSPLTAHFHLGILQRFRQLYASVENSASSEAGKSANVQEFLVSAEARYVRYLQLLDEFAGSNDSSSKRAEPAFVDEMPLPPWDVAIIFHAHCLNPYRFFADMNRRHPNLWNKGISFPLERLFALIVQGVWSDAASESAWMGNGKSAPYQVWSSDPTQGGQLELQYPRFTCPWCHQTKEIPVAEFTHTHTTKSLTSKCRSCGRHFDADTLSARFLQLDILECIKQGTGWTIKGAVSGLHDPTTPEEEVAGVDLQIILKTTLLPEAGTTARATRTHLATYAASTAEARWTDIMSSFQKTTAQLTGARLLRMLSRGNVFPAIRVAYQGILCSDLSIDLVAAALRQREFLTKITSADCAGIDTPATLLKATTRYHKFLLLMRRKTQGKSAQKKTSLVPTLDIDLLWHTHQLNAVSYRQWCIQHLGIAVNHDDSVGKEVLDDGLKDTTRAWYEAYREPYAVNEVGGAEKVGKISKIFSRKKSVETNSLTASNGMPEYTSMYAYWLNYPQGWQYPASCTNSKGVGGWAASVDQQRELSSNVAAKCAGCTSGCTYVYGD